MRWTTTLGALAVSLLSASLTLAQQQDDPLSLQAGLVAGVPEKVMSAVDNKMLEAQTPPKNGRPLDFAVAHDVKIGLDQGRWDVVGDKWIWRIKVTSNGAKSINLGFTTYRMPAGGELHVYPSSYTGGSPALVRRFTAADNEAHGQLWTPIVESSSVIIEAVVPEAVRSQLRLELTKVNHAYRSFRKDEFTIKSGSCNVDVLCPEGDSYRNQIRSVGVLSLNGRSLCTGSAINNTGARRPLFITADHCGLRATNAASVVVYWNFQHSVCRPVGSGSSGGAGNGQLTQFNSGSNFLATFSTSDVTLVELDDAPQTAFNVFLAGWDRRPGPFADGAVGIHHPSVDEKRISHSNRATEDDGGTHHRVWWRPGIGVTEPGSSGSPVYTKQGRFIGQLTGGASACGVADSSMWDVYGKLSRSWDGGGSTATRVREHLDPAGAAPMMIDGRNWNDTGTPTPSPTPTPTPTPTPGATPTPTPTPTPGMPSTNLALGRPATGSASCNANEGPAKALNGSVAGGNTDKWCSLATGTKQLRVDLGSSMTVRRVVVRHAQAGGESATWNTRVFTLETSTDGTNFTNAVTVTTNTAANTTHTITARTARYVRLSITAPTQTGTGGAARIYELEVYAN